MEQAKTKTRTMDFLLILAMFIVARISCPALSNIPIFSIAFTFVYGAAFVFLFLLVAKFKNSKDFGLLLAAAAYTIYVVIKGVSAGNSMFARDSFNAFVILFLTVIYVWAKGESLAKRALIFKLILATLIFDYVYSIMVLIKDPGASRTAAALSVLEKSPYDVLNAIGGFDAVYGGLSVIVALLCLRQTLKQNKTKNITTLLVLILAIVFVVMAAYTTALILLILSAALYLVRKNKLFPLILILLVFAFLLFHVPIGNWIMNISYNITYSEVVSEKFYDFGYMVKYFKAAGTYAGDDGRFSELTLSWSTFKQYPLLGSMGRQIMNVGGHSEFFDYLAKFGLAGFSLLIAYFVCLYRDVRSCLDSTEMKRGWNIIVFVFIVSAVLNPSLYSLQMMPLIIMVPLAQSYAEMCKIKRKRLGDQQ